jgi:hypothetical protein
MPPIWRASGAPASRRLRSKRYLQAPTSLPEVVEVTVIGIDPPVVTERPCAEKLVGVKLPVLVLVVV